MYTGKFPNSLPFTKTERVLFAISVPTVKLLNAYRQAKAPMEAHIYYQGGHGFNMGNRSKLHSLKTWPDRLADWLSDTGLLSK